MKKIILLFILTFLFTSCMEKQEEKQIFESKQESKKIENTQNTKKIEEENSQKKLDESKYDLNLYEKYKSKFGISFFHKKGEKYEDTNEFCYDQEKTFCLKGNLIISKNEYYSSVLKIQIFEKDKNQSFENYVLENIIDKKNKDKCYVKKIDLEQNFFSNLYFDTPIFDQKQMIFRQGFDILTNISKEESQKLFSQEEKENPFYSEHTEICGNYGKIFNALEIFLGNENENKFLFLSLGQDTPSILIDTIRFEEKFN